MNRRGFLGLLGKASIGAYVAYSFPSIIVPNNLILPENISTSFISQLNEITRREIYPNLIEDIFFKSTSFGKYLQLHKLPQVPPSFEEFKNNYFLIN